MVFVVHDGGNISFQSSKIYLSTLIDLFLGWDEKWPRLYTWAAMTSQRSHNPCGNKLIAHCEVASMPVWSHDSVTLAVSPIVLHSSANSQKPSHSQRKTVHCLAMVTMKPRNKICFIHHWLLSERQPISDNLTLWQSAEGKLLILHICKADHSCLFDKCNLKTNPSPKWAVCFAQGESAWPVKLSLT